MKGYNWKLKFREVLDREIKKLKKYIKAGVVNGSRLFKYDRWTNCNN